MVRKTLIVTDEELRFLQWACVCAKVQAQLDLKEEIGNREQNEIDIVNADHMLNNINALLVK